LDEVWRLIPGYEDYSVSNFGNVKRQSSGKGTRAGRSIKACRDAGGRMVFNVRAYGKTKQVKIHRVVMLAFVGKCPIELEVAHLDGNQANNILANLVYATPKENNSHKVGHGTQKRGEQIHCAKLNQKKVNEIRESYPQLSYSKLAKKYDVAIGSIVQVVKRRSWSHV
jgi:hypothetical protein